MTRENDTVLQQSTGRHNVRRAWHHHSRKALTVVTWNVRSLVENSGDERICRKCPQGGGNVGNRRSGPQSVDRKLDLVVKELRRYRVSVAGIQETKWFGKDVWFADGYTFLHSGRPLPSDRERATRNEGVGIALDQRATTAWKEAGEMWEAVNSRIITARLKLAKSGQRQPGGSRETTDSYMTVVSVYAPTAKAPPGVKQRFSADLQDVLNKIPQSDVLIVLGDFNARVGKRDLENDLWPGTLGKHGLGESNQAGEEFLEFCATNQ